MVSINFIFFFLIFKISFITSFICPENCVTNNCEPPINCFAGIVKDKCNCCYVCGQLEGERCFNKTIKGLPKSYQRYPTCGEYLKCELRDDLAEGDQIEAVCICKNNEPICGTDGQTYENQCKLIEERYKRRDGLTSNSRGPCKVSPQITSPPDNIFNKTDSNVAFSCEASGYPIPIIEWKFISQKDPLNTSERLILKSLPSDDSHIAVQSRGGPNTYEVTSWLQILKTQISDSGYYYCIAKNSEGEDSAFGKLIIADKKENLNNLENSLNEIQ